MRHKIYHVLIVLLLLMSSATIAETHQQHHDNHAAHVHGLANLMIAIENNDIEIQLETPAVNLLGFEHKANTSEEIQLVEDTKRLLNSPEKVFSLINTNCKSKQITIDASAIVNNEDNHHEHGDSDDGHDDHSEITAHYYFTCDEIKDLNKVSIHLFEHFPALEQINAMWITDTEQAAAVLSKDNNTVQLR